MSYVIDRMRGGRMERSRVAELHYIVPVDNLSSIMERGIVSHRRARTLPHVSVADEHVQDRRRGKRVPNGRMLHDYVNVYFDARNPMMYRRREQKTTLAVLRISPAILDTPDAVIADGNAASDATKFAPSPAGLSMLDEERVYAGSWTDPDSWTYFEKKRQRCAEILVPDVIPPRHLLGCYVCHTGIVVRCQEAAPNLGVTVRKDVFFD